MRVFVHVHDGSGGMLSAQVSRGKKHKPADIEDLVSRLKRAMRIVGMDAITDAVSANISRIFKARDEGTGHSFHGNQWTGGIGGGPKPTKAVSKGVQSGVHELLTSGHHFTMAELIAATGASGEKQMKQVIAMLQNPKWAGSKGVLTIKKVDGGFVVGENTGHQTKAEADLENYAAIAAEHKNDPSDFSAEFFAAEPIVPNVPIEKPPEPPKPDPVAIAEAIGVPALTPSKAAGIPFGNALHPVPGVNGAQEADKFYKEQLNVSMHTVHVAMHVMGDSFVGQGALAFKKSKALAMSQWSANVNQKTVTPKEQEAFKADYMLMQSLQKLPIPKGNELAGFYDAALAKWKADTKLEKMGKLGMMEPPGAINPMPKPHIPAPVVETHQQLSQTQPSPASYVPEGYEGVQPEDFTGAGTNGKFALDIGKLKSKLADGHPNAVQNKIGVQGALEQRLADSVAFQAIQAESKTNGYPSLAAKLISSWAGSSGDHQPISVANQLAIRDAFHMKPEDVTTSAFHLLDSVKHDENEVYKQAAIQIGYKIHTPARLETFKAGLRDFALAQYHNTQDHFKELGLTHVSVVRGMQVDHKQDAAEMVNLKLQPASSFSANFQTAKSFSGGKSMYYAKVPISQVLSSYVTGFGCTNEHEVVVLAHPGMKAVRASSGNSGSTMGTASEHIRDSLKVAPKATTGMPKFVMPSSAKAKGLNYIAVKAKEAAKKGDIAGVKAAHAELSSHVNPVTGKLKYPNSTAIVQSLIEATETHAQKVAEYKASKGKK